MAAKASQHRNYVTVTLCITLAAFIAEDAKQRLRYGICLYTYLVFFLTVTPL